jgi:uncharacterized membrane protein YobD (UPF0266 family)
MRFAAGITVSGIIGLLIMELVKAIGPSIVNWIVGVLALLLKVALIGLFLLAVLIVIGVAVFFYRRGQRARGEL